MKLKQDNVVKAGSTKFYLMKRCMQCFHTCEFQLTRCPQCKYFFVEQATEEEKNQVYKKLLKMQEAKEEQNER